MDERRTVYTTAPEAYDGFGTTREDTGKVFVGSRPDVPGKPVYRVSILPEHFTWQTMRYSSGMYPSWTQTDFDELSEHALIVAGPEEQGQ